MRSTLNTLYRASGILAAIFMIGTLAMVLASVLGRMFHFNLRGSDAYAGYCMAAAGFLALAHTLKRGEHIRVTLILERLAPTARHRMELLAHTIALFFAALFAFFAARLVYQSYLFNDISQGNDATPLWIPQFSMALGAAILFIAILDESVLLALKRNRAATSSEFKALE